MSTVSASASLVLAIGMNSTTSIQQLTGGATGRERFVLSQRRFSRVERLMLRQTRGLDLSTGRRRRFAAFGEDDVRRHQVGRS